MLFVWQCFVLDGGYNIPVFESKYGKRMYDFRGDNCGIWCDSIEYYNIHFTIL